MTATRSIPRRSWALLTALMLFAALVVPILASQKAEAATTDNSCRLDVTAETSTNPTGTTHTLVANVTNSAGTDTGTGSCIDSTTDTYEVDFEVESGAAVTFNATSTSTSTGASDADNSPTSPDATCTVGEADIPGTPEVDENSQCTVQFTSATAGTNVVRAWVDDDKDNSTVDADTTEGRDEATVPGNRTEIDDTDVVSKTWFTALAANTRLDCDDASSGNAVATSDHDTNPAGVAETYTCQAYVDVNVDGDFDSATDTPVSGALVDVEIADTGGGDNGPNDPDNRGFTTVTNLTADVNNAGTTGADGKFTYSLAPTENQVGTAEACFWIDSDNDAEYDGSNIAGDEDGNECRTETLNEGEAGAFKWEADDTTDKVEKIWQARVATAIDASPEISNNLQGTQHTVTAVVVDQFGDPVTGALVDFDVEGRNDSTALEPEVESNNAVTNASGVATFTYTDGGLPALTGAQVDDDVVSVCLVDGTQATDQTCSVSEAAPAEPVSPDDADNVDAVTKHWYATVPTTSDIVLDADNTVPCEATDATAEDSATNAVATEHEFCATAFQSAGVALPGAEVTYTIDGPGVFYGDTNNNDTFDATESELGTTTTVSADANGRAEADMYSEESGVATVTATSGAQSDTVTKTYTALTPRNIDCLPKTATNKTGTQHVITCTATDRYANPTDGVGAGDDEVAFTEIGAGRVTSDSTPLLNSDGTVDVVVETIADEEGTENITAELEADVGNPDGPADLDDACDQPADVADGGGGVADPGAPAGNCEDTVEKIWSDTAAVVEHPRTLTLNKMRHVKDGGKRKLFVKGNLSADDGFAACESGQKVKLQKKVSGSWFTKKSDTTGAAGGAKFLVKDKTGRYRLKAPASTVDAENTCGKATSNVKRHRHKKKAAAKYYR